jgi:hypothetical protein
VPKPLSPAQSIVKDFDDRYELLGPLEDDWQEQCLAAALRGLVNEVMPERPLWTRTAEERTLYHEGRLDAAIRFRAEILAIADELETQ